MFRLNLNQIKKLTPYQYKSASTKTKIPEKVNNNDLVSQHDSYSSDKLLPDSILSNSRLRVKEFLETDVRANNIISSLPENQRFSFLKKLILELKESDCYESYEYKFK